MKTYYFIVAMVRGHRRAMFVSQNLRCLVDWSRVLQHSGPHSAEYAARMHNLYGYEVIE
jgi:hypothetical protein